MRVRDHIALSTAVCAGLTPRLGARRAVGLWAGSVLIDADHLMWYCAHTRRLNPRAALKFFNGPDVPRTRRARLLHSPVAVAGALLAARHRDALMPVAIGMGAHVTLDALHEMRLNQARAMALARDRYTCVACCRRSAVVTHVWRQPLLLPSFRADNVVSLCSECHASAHAGTLEVATCR